MRIKLKILNNIYNITTDDIYIFKYFSIVYRNFLVSYLEFKSNIYVVNAICNQLTINNIHFPILDADDCIGYIISLIKKHLVDENPDYILMHGGVVEYNKKIFAILGPSGCGKSTFCSLIMSYGGVCFCDDIFLINKQDLCLLTINRSIVVRKDSFLKYNEIHGQNDFLAINNSEYLYNSQKSSINILHPNIFISILYNTSCNLTEKINDFESMKILMNNCLSSKFPTETYETLFKVSKKIPFYKFYYSDINQAIQNLNKIEI